jgi:hypothetical protein
MIEFVSTTWPNTITQGAVCVELEMPGLRQGALCCEIGYKFAKSESLSLTVDSYGFFEILVDTQPLDLEVSGNRFTEAADPNNLNIWEYSWNPISKLLKGRVAI